jgi:hypothetical protein
MRWLWLSCLLLASLLPLSAEDWTTEDGKTYKNVTVVGQEDDGVRITYDGGVGKIPYYELPVDIQKRFGQDVDSLAAKKQAVDKAIQDAAQSAAAAGEIRLPVEAPTPVYVAPQPGLPQGTAPNGAMPAGATPNGAPGGATTTTGGPSGAAAPNAMIPNGPPGAQTNSSPGAAAPNTASTPGAHPGTSVPGHAGPVTAEPMPALQEPISHTPAPTGIMAAGGKPLQLAVSNYTYNDALDVCYLDSPAIDVYPDPLPKTPLPPGQGSSLTMRIVTDGRTPQAPDRFELTFLSVGGDAAGGDFGLREIVFNTDDTQFTVDDSAKKDSGSLPGGGQAVQYVSFYLDPSRVHQIANAKTLTFLVGSDRYRFDDRGITTLRSYLGDVDTLAPASSSLVRNFYKLLARIPSFFEIISTVCEYVILGSFALLVAASIAAFILGISRFIKM